MSLSLITKLPRVLLSALFLLSLLTLSACTPHPASGNWVASGDNAAHFSKMLVHFESRLEIFTDGIETPTHYCGWSATSSQNIGIECLRSEDQEVKDIYQLNVEGEDKAELIKDGKVIARFIQLPE
ncbi:MAG: hypothetical protein DIZ80_12610 [endosymbiont of Galathealinum brachiosum]|uniref:DUF306 domain-containing protein n=1 Tax=endosymbiont of Galathealinum brachiosum TaxID=2200906 RepID=A0A370DDV0_9GAMM|nr:MAG: hypothetical protein DIZ80_12610 [endosymbiont of Galathealinum brachiosum]